MKTLKSLQMRFYTLNMNISLFNLFHLVAIVAPLVVGSSVNEACSKGGEDKVVTLLQFLLILPESQRNSGCRSISEVLDKVAARVIPPWELKVTQVNDSRLEIAGPENARRCRPAHLNDGVLYIEVFHPAYRMALETPAIKQNLLKRIQEITGVELCQSIKFIAGGRTPMPRR